MDAKSDYSGTQDMYIGLVTETYPPEVNGVAMTLSRLVDGLQSRNHRIDVFRPAQSSNDNPDNTGAVQEVLMPGLPIPGYNEMHFGFPAKRFFLRHWHSNRPHALYVATEGPLGSSAIAAARKLGIPVISGFHTNFHSYSRHYRLGWMAPLIFAYLRRLHNKTRATLVPTNALAGELSDRGFHNVRVMQRGVDNRLFTPERRDDALRDQWGADDNTIVCLYVGRIAAEKNIQQAVDTYKALSSHYRVRFVLVGDGPLREPLQKAHPDFIFCGTRTGEPLAAHFASADVLLFPSRTETFGNVVTEAMASGLAVVAYNEAAAHEHIRDWENGVLADDTESHGFTAVAMRLCRQPASIRSIGGKASLYCRDLGWPVIVQQFESLLAESCEHSTAVNERECASGVTS